MAVKSKTRYAAFKKKVFVDREFFKMTLVEMRRPGRHVDPARGRDSVLGKGLRVVGFNETGRYQRSWARA